MMELAWWRSRDGGKQKMELEYADGNRRGRGGYRRPCVRRIPAGQFEDEHTDGRSEAKRVCGVSGNKRRNKSRAVGDCHGAVRRGRFANIEYCCKFDEGEKRRCAG